MSVELPSLHIAFRTYLNVGVDGKVVKSVISEHWCALITILHLSHLSHAYSPRLGTQYVFLPQNWLRQQLKLLLLGCRQNLAEVQISSKREFKMTYILKNSFLNKFINDHLIRIYSDYNSASFFDYLIKSLFNQRKQRQLF